MHQPAWTPNTPTYRLLAQKLGRDPLLLIHQRRAAGMSYARIAEELRQETGEYITHEVPRRWHRAAQKHGVNLEVTQLPAAA